MSEMKTNDLVSVIVTTHNRCNLMKRAVKSIQNQSYANLEIIIIDDNSSDNTKAYADELVKNDSRIKYIKIPKSESKGGNYARNKGIDNSRGEYVAFLDDDDVWHSNKVEKQLAHLKKHIELGAVSCEMRFVYDFGNKQYFDFSNTKLDERPLGFFVNSWLNTTSTIMARRDVLVNVGMFDLLMPALQECELSYRICLNYKVEILKDVLVDYYIFPNVSGQITSSMEKNKQAISRISSKYKKELSELLPEQAEARMLSIKRGEAMRFLRGGNKKEYRAVLRQMWKNTSKWEKMEYYLTYVLGYPEIIRLKCRLKEKRGAVKCSM